MKQCKKALILILVLTCAINLTGCGQIKKGLKSLGKSIENTYQKIIDNYEDAKAAKSKKELTSEEYDDIVKRAYDEQGTFSKFGTWFKSRFSGMSKYDYYASHHEEVVRDKVEMAVNDKKLAAEREKEDALIGSLKGGSGTAIILLVVLAVVVLLLLFIFAKMRMSSAPPVRRVVVPVQESGGNKKWTGDVSVNYERLLRDNCSKLGLDYSDTLRQYGDVRTAVDATNLQVFAKK